MCVGGVCSLLSGRSDHPPTAHPSGSPGSEWMASRMLSTRRAGRRLGLGPLAAEEVRLPRWAACTAAVPTVPQASPREGDLGIQRENLAGFTCAGENPSQVSRRAPKPV